MPLSPPPTAESYPSLDAVMEAVNRHARIEGYAITKQRSKKTKGGIVNRVYLHCDKGGVPKSTGQGLRRSASRRLNCPFSMVAHLNSTGWNLLVRVPEHNHEPSQTPVVHPAHRKLAASARQTIVAQAHAGIAPRQILETLRQADPEMPITYKDITNIRAHQRQHSTGGNNGGTSSQTSGSAGPPPQQQQQTQLQALVAQMEAAQQAAQEAADLAAGAAAAVREYGLQH